MKIGLVSYLNARPLDFGFRRSGEHELLQGTPAQLFSLLKTGELDTALISSVECLRNKELAFCNKAGVCARGPVGSILYFEKKGSSFLSQAPEIIYVDSGSRSSVALLEILMQKELGALPVMENRSPKTIPELTLQNQRRGGLLIGDAALDFMNAGPNGQFNVLDLSAWWYETEKLPFVFALWAYPARKSVTDHAFEESLAMGLAAMEEIVAESPYAMARKYLTESLHYQLDSEDLAGLAKFKEYLIKFNLL